MGTVKRDIPAVEASYESSSLPLYTFQNISVSGFRQIEKESNGMAIAKNTALDRYIQRSEKDILSFYDFICKNGKVPVLTGCYTQASWPLNENYGKTMLLLHTPNWRKISDIKDDDMTWFS
jgi:hypothetical protein